MRVIKLLLFLCFFPLIGFAESAPQQDPSLLLRNVWSPYCKGVSLMECPSSQAEKLRNEIYSRMKAGESFEVIFKDLTDRYGPVLRMTPDFEGRESAAYWIPWIATFAAAVFVGLFWMTRRRRSAAPRSQPIASDPKLESRILEELNERRS